MGVFHTIAMSCTMGALSLNNSSQNCHHLQTSHSSCWQSFFFHLPASLCNLNHGLLTTLCRIPQYQLLNRAKEDRSRIQHLLFNPRTTRGFQPFQNPHPPLSSRDPSLDLDRRSTDPPTDLLPPTFPHRPSPTDLSFTNTSSTNTSSPNPSLTKLNFPTPTTLCESSITLSTFATRGIRASPKQCLSSSTASLQDPRSHLKPVRNCLFSFLQLGIPRC